MQFNVISSQSKNPYWSPVCTRRNPFWPKVGPNILTRICLQQGTGIRKQKAMQINFFSKLTASCNHAVITVIHQQNKNIHLKTTDYHKLGKWQVFITISSKGPKLITGDVSLNENAFCFLRQSPDLPQGRQHHSAPSGPQYSRGTGPEGLQSEHTPIWSRHHSLWLSMWHSCFTWYMG